VRRPGKPSLLTSLATAASALGLLLLTQGPATAQDTGTPDTTAAGWHIPFPPLPSPPFPEPRACMALYNLTSEQKGSFRATVEVMNHTTDPMLGWSVTWKPSDGTHITRVHGGWLSHHADGTVTVRPTWATAYIPPNDQEVTFDIVARSDKGWNFPNGSMSCTSP
jgi:chitin-binding protein